jgi:hypothetical protein
VPSLPVDECGAAKEEAERVFSNTSSIAAEAARPPAFLDILVVGCLLALCTVGAWLAFHIGALKGCGLASASWARREGGGEDAALEGGRLARRWDRRANPDPPPNTAHTPCSAHGAELKAYDVQFDALVRSLQSDARRQVDARLVAAQTGAMMLSQFPSLARGVGTNVPYFMAAAAQLRHLTNSSFAQWLFVVNDADRARFESNARTAAVVLNYTQRPIGNLSGYRNASHPPPVMGRQPHYAPLYASSPRTPETDARLLGDCLTLPAGPTIERVIAEGRVLMTRYCITPSFHWTPGVAMDSPAVVVVAPSWAFVSGHLREDPVGGTIDPLNVTSSLPPSPANGDKIMLLNFQWESLIAQTLPSRLVDGLEVVLQPPEGPAVTFAVRKGNKVVFVGTGDLHARKEKPKHRTFSLFAGQDEWVVHVYGTAALRKKVRSFAPTDRDEIRHRALIFLRVTLSSSSSSRKAPAASAMWWPSWPWRASSCAWCTTRSCDDECAACCPSPTSTRSASSRRRRSCWRPGRATKPRTSS